MEQNVFGQRLSVLRKNKGLSQEKLAKNFDVTRQAAGSWETGTIPREPILSGLANFFNVSTDFLLGIDQPNSPADWIEIPILGRIVAGTPIEAITDIIGYEEIPPKLAKTGEFFALQVTGDSMFPRVCDGDVVIVRKQADVNSGEVAVVLVNGDDATLKRVIKKDDGIVLQADNPVVYSPQFYSLKEIEELPIEILGVVVEQRRKGKI
jgi:SOS-response transcriptional repressors (RecA-mediated autopeptidases)